MTTKKSSERFKPLTLEEMTPAQRRMAENLLSGPRKGMKGPFSALLYSPEMGDAAQELGARVRFKNSLPEKLKELAILTVARFWTAQYEWYAHRRLALEAGLGGAVIDAIAAGERPAAMTADEAAIYAFATELLETREVSDATFAAVKERFGEKGVIDLICTMGYYTLVSMTLNVNRYPLPEGVTPLKKLK
jgi:4-carboxymuconolactone decarboxylase